mgnify:CR=1 FL=1
MAKLLVVDDEQGICSTMEAALAAAGHEVQLADSGEMALSLMRRSNPDILITDLRMPHIDGCEFLRQLSSHALYQQLTVLVITGLSDAQIKQMGGLPKNVQVLRKPLDLDWFKGFFDAFVSLRKKAIVTL